MTRDDIIHMARESWGEGKVYCFTSPKYWPEVEDMFVRFADIIASAEREACAKVCFDAGLSCEVRQGADLCFELSGAIRARSNT